VTTHTSHPQGTAAQISVDHDTPVVLVTGGAGGIGEATLQRFIAGGWRTASVDLQPSQVGGVVNVITDVRRVDQCRAAVEHVVASLGRLDAVVNAAGVWHEGDTATTSEDDFDRVIDVNLKGTYFVSAAALAHLERSRGCIINLSSDAGLQGNSGAAAYCASKGGVSLFTKALAARCSSQRSVPGRCRLTDASRPSAQLRRRRTRVLRPTTCRIPATRTCTFHHSE
jgi:NAD(P)-dependent dehydrogenase (short-subunit alcohol dehydrogenase family)